jgi:hypothetical protein
VITSVKDRLIQEIDGRPAIDVVDEWSGGRVKEAMRAGKNMNPFMALFPLCRTMTENGKSYNLFTHAWPPDNAPTTKHLQASATLSKGDLVFFSEGSWNVLINRIGMLPQEARESRPNMRAAGALFICCEGVFNNIPPEERGQIAFLLNRSLGDIPWLGMATWGEQGNFPGVGNYHGNLLTSITLFPAGSAATNKK